MNEARGEDNWKARGETACVDLWFSVRVEWTSQITFQPRLLRLGSSGRRNSWAVVGQLQAL